MRADTRQVQNMHRSIIGLFVDKEQVGADSKFACKLVKQASACDALSVAAVVSVQVMVVIFFFKRLVTEQVFDNGIGFGDFRFV